MKSVKQQIATTGKTLAALNPTGDSLKSLEAARDWWQQGAVSRYSYEDFDVLQSLISAVHRSR